MTMPQRQSWEADLRVGVPFMDHDHDGLRMVLEDLGRTLETDGSSPTNDVQRSLILERLISQFRRHCDHEETAMREHGYPLTDEHTLQHARFFQNLDDMRGQYIAGRGAEITVQIVHFVQTWFARHTLTSDGPLADWLLTHGHADAEPPSPLLHEAS